MTNLGIELLEQLKKSNISVQTPLWYMFDEMRRNGWCLAECHTTFVCSLTSKHGRDGKMLSLELLLFGILSHLLKFSHGFVKVLI